MIHCLSSTSFTADAPVSHQLLEDLEKTLIAMTRTAVFTICARNYIHFATTLFQSTQEYHPEWDRYLIVVDDGIDEEASRGQLFKVVFADSLDIPNPRHFFFQYTLLELCTAVKPWAFEYLLSMQSYDRVIYLDPDIRLYSSLPELESLFNSGHGIIFTPHLTGPLDDGGFPSEREILLSGSWNLGFCAVDNSPHAFDFIRWWKKRLEKHCVVDVARGYFVDQKWCDLVPGLFPNFAALRHEGYNTAYWNLPHRQLHLRRTDSSNRPQIMVNDVPLRFFHFSGFSPDFPAKLSSHENRDSLKQIPELQFLVSEYAKQLFRNGYDTYRHQKNCYSEFKDGEPILDSTRRSFLNRPRDGLPIILDNFDPFEGKDFASTVSLSDSQQLSFTLNMLGVWNLRVDLQEAFPDPQHSDLRRFVEWFVTWGEIEAVLPSPEIERSRKELELLRHQEAVARAQQVQASPAETPSDPSPGFTLLNFYRSIPTRIQNRLLGYSLRSKDYLKRILGKDSKDYVTQSSAGDCIEKASQSSPEQEPASEPDLVELRRQALRKSEPGVTLIGYVGTISGVAHSLQGSAAAIQSEEIPFDVKDINILRGSSRPGEAVEPTYPINLFHINADRIDEALASLPAYRWREKYNIGYWHWELPKLPEKFLTAYDHLDEIWTCSSFIREAITDLRECPVSVIPHPVSPPNRLKMSRETFGLPENRFLFLVMCDTYSYLERKNPYAAIKAFAELDAERLGIGLVIKVLNSYWDARATLRLEALTRDLPYCYFVEDTLTLEQVWNLEYSCDAFVSLHRSEGFGLGIAEHMAIGKPVVATNWSGNVDIMNSENSCPVDYRLVELEENVGPYEKGGIWAEPDISHAAAFMERLASDPDYRGRIGGKGREYALTHLSPQAIGAQYRREFERILGEPIPRAADERRYANCA